MRFDKLDIVLSIGDGRRVASSVCGRTVGDLKPWTNQGAGWSHVTHICTSSFRMRYAFVCGKELRDAIHRRNFLARELVRVRPA